MKIAAIHSCPERDKSVIILMGRDAQGGPGVRQALLSQVNLVSYKPLS